jgi:glycosyltransferase involved in cell wall biosynthesis
MSGPAGTTERVLSIIIPHYYNELNIPDTIPRMLALGPKLPGYRLELVLVDDGSGDRTLELLTDWQRREPEIIRVVKLTRNFGTMGAVQAAMTLVTGDCVVMITADLQDPPEMIIDMVGHWEKGTKAVMAVRTGREESWIKELFANSYYAILRKLALKDFPPGGFDFFLIDRQIVNDLNKIHEKNTHLMSLIWWLGYKPVLLPYIRKDREKGISRWTLSKKIKLVVDSLVAFSYLPIRAVSVVGIVVAIFALVYAAYVVVRWSFMGPEIRGWSSMMVLVALTAGIQMIMLGALGEYLWRTLDESRKRPMYVIDEVIEGKAPRTPK